MRTEPQILDIHLNRKDTTYIPLHDTYLAWSHGVQYKLVTDIEVYDNFIALGLVTHLNLKMESHPDPYLIDDHEYVQHWCKLHFQVSSYEDIWCDVVDL